MSREAHVQFCEGLAGKFRRSTLHFSQGASYWYALGILHDMIGDDIYIMAYLLRI